jgi:hypothetical protein
VDGAFVPPPRPYELAAANRTRGTIEHSLDLDRRSPAMLNRVDGHRQTLPPLAQPFGHLYQVLFVLRIVEHRYLQNTGFRPTMPTPAERIDS